MRTIIGAALLLPALGAAQCTMTLGVTALEAYCGGFFVAYTIQGGTPPFHVVAYNINGTLIDLTTVDQSGSGTFEGTSWDVQVEVTDALGCQASHWAEPTPMLYTHEMSGFTWSTECNTGITTLRMNAPAFPICDPAGLHYVLNTIVGGATQLVDSGTFADDWAEVAGTGDWQLQMPLPPGYYAAEVVPTTLLCTDGFTTWAQCWNIWPIDPGPSNYFGISAGDCGANVLVRANLGGAYVSGAMMRDDLRVAGLVPQSEPYSALGYTFVGDGTGATIDPAWLTITGPRAVVDWVVLEVRTNTALYAILSSKPAILLRNGEVWDTDGDLYVNFGVLPPGFKRLAMKHRNHLGVITAHPIAMYEQPGSPVDFRMASTAYGGSQATMLVGLTRCLWPGDATADGIVKYAGSANDRDAVLSAVGGGTPTNTVNNVYHRRDVNLDGKIKYAGSANDRDIILQTIGGSVPTATRTQQLP